MDSVNVTVIPTEPEVPDNLETLQLTRFVVQRIVVPLVVILGLTGNALSIIVLTHRSMRTSTNCYLTVLAVFDMLYLLFSFGLSFDHYSGIRHAHVYTYWYPVGRVLNDMCGNVSVSLTVTFTIERYIAVRHPMKGRVICTPERARIIALLVAFFASVSSSPGFFEFEYFDKVQGNSTVLAYRRTKFGTSRGYQTFYLWFLSIMFCFLPLIAICTFNWILMRSVYKANKLRRSMTQVTLQRSNERQLGEQNRITLMLISVALVFILCQFPTASMMIYLTYIELAKIELTALQQNNLRIAGNIANLLVLTNAAINFLLYSVMSTKFRKVFVKVICKYCYHEDPKSFNFSEYSYVSGVTYTNRRPSNYKAASSTVRIGKDDSASHLLAIPPSRRSWSPAVSLDHLRYSSESLVRGSPTRSVCNGDFKYKTKDTQL